MTANVRSLGWLGTGRMGAALAGRLIEAGERVTVWNRTAAKTAPLVCRGARAVERIADLGSCDIVFATVSSSRDLEEVVVALLAGTSRPELIVDCSTVSSAASARVRAMADEAGVDFLAAPVSGNPHVVAELLRKDFDLGLEAARSLEVPLPVAAAVHQLIQSAIGIGLRDSDFLSLYEQQARVAGLGLESEG